MKKLLVVLALTLSGLAAGTGTAVASDPPPVLPPVVGDLLGPGVCC